MDISYDHDGSVILKARLPAEAGALLIKALDAAIEALPRPDEDVSAETPKPAPPPLSKRRADAITVMAESFLKHGPEAQTGGDRYQIVVHVDAETLNTSAAGRCGLEDGPAIAAETARRLACDCSAVRIVEDPDGNPLDIGRKTRSIPSAIRRALNSRDRGCRFPGCTHTRYVDAHHVDHWAHGGETKMSNLVILCRFHHRAVHEGQVKVVQLDDGALRFTRPDGRSFDSPTPPLHSPGRLLPVEVQSQIRADAAVSRWRGETLDAGMGVEALLSRRLKSGAGAFQ